MARAQRPSFAELPLHKGSGPRYNAWGLYGADDELGSVNLLNADGVKTAASLIQSGERYALDLPLGFFDPPAFNRLPFTQTITPRPRSTDDVLTFNTQSSTQWDGLRHFRHLESNRFYGNRTYEDVFSGSTIGIQTWVKQGGIVGRAVLIDYAAYMERHNTKYNNFSDEKAITLSDIMAIADEQKSVFKPGDILIIRSGFLKARAQKSKQELEAWLKSETFPSLGVEACEETLRFLWDNQFAAIAGDAPAFESWPCKNAEYFFHENLICGWGMPIGELFNLEELSKACAKSQSFAAQCSGYFVNAEHGLN